MEVVTNVGLRAELTWRTWSVRELSVTMCPPTVTVKLAAERGDGTAPLSRPLLRRSLTLWSTTRGVSVGSRGFVTLDRGLPKGSVERSNCLAFKAHLKSSGSSPCKR